MMPQKTHYSRPLLFDGEYAGESANVSRVLDSFHSLNGYDKRIRPGYKGACEQDQTQRIGSAPEESDWELWLSLESRKFNGCLGSGPEVPELEGL